MQFQYKVIVQENPEALEEDLNAAGEEGFELVSATPNRDGGITVIMEFAADDEGDEDEDEDEEDEDEDER